MHSGEGLKQEASSLRDLIEAVDVEQKHCCVGVNFLCFIFVKRGKRVVTNGRGYHGITPLLPWHYATVTMTLLHCYHDITPLLPWHYSTVTMALLHRYHGITPVRSPECVFSLPQFARPQSLIGYGSRCDKLDQAETRSLLMCFLHIMKTISEGQGPSPLAPNPNP